MAVPRRRRLADLALVFAGGTLGVLARELLILAVPDAGGVPAAVLLANLAGSFVLGVLLEMLARPGRESPGRRSMRLLLGTGLIGGFTTYSALAQAMASMLSDGALVLALGYGLGTVLAGGLAAWCGIVVGARFGRIRRGRVPSGGDRV